MIQFVTEAGWQDQRRQPSALHAFLTPDNSKIVLMAAANDWDSKIIATHLDKLTCGWEPVLVDGRETEAVTIPCTWGNVVQLGFTFANLTGITLVHHGRLRDWIGAEEARRRAEPPELEPSWPPWVTPRDYQIEAARQIAAAGRYFFLLDDMGLGKAQPVSTPVWTPSGWTEIGDLRPGDLVYDRYGRAVPVRSVHPQGERDIYRVTFSDRTSTLADGGHLWQVFTPNDRARGSEHGRVLTTDQIREAGFRNGAGNRRFALPQQPVVLGGSDLGLPLDPYAYGALLGDGCLGGANLSITCPDSEILWAVAWNTPDDRCQNLAFHRGGELRTILGSLGARCPSGSKFVHSRYLAAGVRGRRALLAGLLDTDGCVADGCIEFSSASVQLAADVAFLARSLGAVVTESGPQAAGYRDSSGDRVECQDKHRLTIRFPEDGPNPFRVPRKADAWTAMVAGLQRKNPPRMIESVEPAGRDQAVCIALDTDDDNARVYLTDRSLIPTHNTVTAILGVEQRRRTGIPVFPMVILVPSWEVADAWDAEIRKWMPGWGDPVMYAGTGRLRLLRHPGARVLITTYATARLDAKDAGAPLTKFAAPCVIADEASLIQNSKAKQAGAAERITRSARTVIELSGTLITRDVAGAFHPLKVADRKTWASKERYTAKFCLSRPSDFQAEITGLNPLTEAEFRACLLGQMTRRAKADVLKELPPKTYAVLRPEIPPDWRQAYDQMREDMLAALPGNDEELEVMDTLSQLTRLSQLASSAADVRYEEVQDKRTGLWVKKAIVTLRPPSWKAEVLMTMLAGATQPVAVFTASRQLARIVGEHYLRPAGLRYDYIIGQGDGVTRRTRKQAMLDFQDGKLDVIVCTAGAGGLGITLTRAPDAVMLQRPWPLDQALQPEDRIHRLGQLADRVTITDVVARDTVDERVRELLREKAGQLSQFVRDPRIVRELLGGKR